MTRVRALMVDPIDLTLAAVFVCMSALYVWRTNTAIPLALHGGARNQYNELADAFLHFHLWIARLPATVLGPEPLNPARRPAFLDYYYGEDALYRGAIYIPWGPTPVLILLIPLHLLGFEPSASVVMAPLTIAGLGFALAALRASVRLLGDVPLWMCALAAATLACASVVPYILGVSEVYHEAIAGGYCFTMAGLWLAVSAVVERRASLARLALMSLCFGLAAGSRPTLGLAALIIVPVYAALKLTRPRRELLIALAAPVGACFLLFAAYNDARFGSVVEIGTKYQLNAGYRAHWGSPGYVPIGVWSYLLTPPRLSAVFPFLAMAAPPLSYPLSLPAHYAPASEPTSGLMLMAPIAILVVALPWIWRRRPELLGALAPLLLAMACAGVGILLFLSYEFFATTERYEVDFATLFVFGSLIVWLALGSKSRVRHRRLAQIGGGALATWSCVAGLAFCYQGLENQPATLHTLVDLGSPLSTAIATAAGHPILAEVHTPSVMTEAPETYGSLGTSVTGFSLSAGDDAELTIVSPDSRDVTLVADIVPGPALSSGATLEARVDGPGSTSHDYRLPSGASEARMVVHLARGVSRLALSAISTEGVGDALTVPRLASGAQVPELMSVSGLHLAGG
jgi:hypothetical protein